MVLRARGSEPLLAVNRESVESRTSDTLSLNMAIFRFRDWVFDVDVPGTRRSYAEWLERREETEAIVRKEMEEVPELKSAVCRRCLNYRTARTQGSALPQEVSALFADLGMTPLFESEILCDAKSPVSGRFYYLVFYGFLGRILEGRDALRPRPGGSDYEYFEDLAPDFAIGFTKSPFVGGPFDHRLPQVETQIAVWLDWVLSEPDDRDRGDPSA